VENESRANSRGVQQEAHRVTDYLPSPVFVDAAFGCQDLVEQIQH
jgi:hypothetical protein